MQNFIKQIVEELIALDKELASDREALEALVAKLLAAKPKVKLDAAFRKRLKREILQQLQSSNQEYPQSFNLFSMQKFFYSFAGVAVALLIVLPFWQPWNASQGFDFTSGVSIKRVADNAFGSFLHSASTGNALGAVSAMGKGGGGGGVATEVATPQSADSRMIMPPYELTAYKYIYKGEIPLPTADVEVLKRVKDIESSSFLAQSLSGFDLGLVGLSKMQNLKVTNFSLSEDKDLGYDAYISLTDGSISINQNYLRWPDPYRDCKGEQSCYDNLRLKESDMLSDEEALQTAAAFAKQYGVNLSNYGEPYVDHQWKLDFARATDKVNYYFPDSATVIYPLLIDGKALYNQNGDKEGITFNVSVRQKAVSGVWGLNTQNYEASNYAAASDVAQFQRFIEKGGLYGYTPENPSKTIEVELGDPEMVLMHYYDYDGVNNTELVVPALRFSIPNPPEGQYYFPRAIVIPLVKQILDQVEKNNPPIAIPFAASDTVKADTATPEATPAVTPTAIDSTSTPTSETTTIANPASVKCEKDGYKLEIVTAADGSQSGFCKNAEGKGCDEWEYFRGECEIPPVG